MDSRHVRLDDKTVLVDALRWSFSERIGRAQVVMRRIESAANLDSYTVLDLLCFLEKRSRASVDLKYRQELAMVLDITKGYIANDSIKERNSLSALRALLQLEVLTANRALRNLSPKLRTERR